MHQFFRTGYISVSLGCSSVAFPKTSTLDARFDCDTGLLSSSGVSVSELFLMPYKKYRTRPAKKETIVNCIEIKLLAEKRT